MNKRSFLAAKGLIEFNGKVLIIRESVKYKEGTQAGKYDVPGGRLKNGETFEETLKREAKEEIGIDIEIKKPFFTNEVTNHINKEEWKIRRTFFLCASKSDEVKLCEDHDDFIWIKPSDYKKYGLIKNLNPVFEEYLKNY